MLSKPVASPRDGKWIGAGGDWGQRLGSEPPEHLVRRRSKSWWGVGGEPANRRQEENQVKCKENFQKEGDEQCPML